MLPLFGYRRGQKKQQEQERRQQQQQQLSGDGGDGGGGGGVARGPVTSTTDDHNNLRTTCDGCTIAKIKCDGGHPCRRCLRRNSACVYQERKRCGPKPRNSSTRGDSDEGGGSHNRVLTSREEEYLSKFFNSPNKFIPVTCITVILDAMNPLQLAVVPGVSPSEAEETIYHARRAVLLGCVSVGAVFSGDQGLAGAYMERAQMHLKHCFDALLPEVVSCYLVMVVYHLHFLDRVKVYRYIGFAQQAYRELMQSQSLVAQASGAYYVKDSLRFLSIFLHVACSNTIPVEEDDPRLESNPEPDGGSLSRVISLYSNILLQLYHKSNPDVAARAGPSQRPMPHMKALAAMANEADALLSMMDDPGSVAVVLIKTLRGYFLLMDGAHTEPEVLETVALPVAKALDADAGVLYFPMSFVMCQAAYAFLLRKGHSAADGMNDVMQPVRPTLAYASLGCGLALQVFTLFAGEDSVIPAPGGNGLFPAAACPSRGPSPVPASLSSSRRMPPPPASEDRDHYSFGGDHSSGGGGGGGGFAVPAPGFASPMGGNPQQPHYHHFQQQQQQQHLHHYHHHHHHHPQQPQRNLSISSIVNHGQMGSSTDGMMSWGAEPPRARPQGGAVGAPWPTMVMQGSAPDSAWGGVQQAPSFNSQGNVPGMLTGRAAAAVAAHVGGGGIPRYDPPYPPSSGSAATATAPATSMGLWRDPVALAFDLAGGNDAFFGLNTESSSSVDGNGATGKRKEGGMGRGES